MLTIQDIQDISYLRFLDTPEHHQQWIRNTFKYQPGDQVMGPSPWGGYIGNDELTNAVVLDYQRGKYDHVIIRTDPGTVIESGLRVRADSIYDITVETKSRMFFEKRVHDIAQKAYFDGDSQTYKGIIDREIFRSPTHIQDDLTRFFRVFGYDGLQYAWRGVENQID